MKRTPRLEERACAATLPLVNRLSGRWGEALTGSIVRRVPRVTGGSSERVPCRRLGLQWELDLRDNLQRRLYLQGSYEKSSLREVRKLLRPTDTVLDVGANIGTFALPIARELPGGRLVAVEPAPDARERLSVHVAANDLADRVTVVGWGLGAVAGETPLYAGPDAADTGLRSIHGSGKSLGKIEIKLGDDLLAELGIPNVDVLKLDVEGAEMDVISGLRRTLSNSPPRVILAEVNTSHLATTGRASVDLVEALAGLGYEGSRVRARGLRRPAEGTYPDGNYLFVRGPESTP